MFNIANQKNDLQTRTSYYNHKRRLNTKGDRMKRIILVLGALALAAPLFASEPFLNPSGLVSMPTGEVRYPYEMNLSYSRSDLLHDEDDWMNKFATNRQTLSAHYSPLENLQIGASVIVDKYNEPNLGADIHYQVGKEFGNNPAVAVGVQQLGSDYVSYYAVATKHIFPDFMVHLGVGLGDYRNEGPSKEYRGLMLGAEKVMWDGFSVFAEMDSRAGNIGARMKVNDHLGFNFAISEIENWVLDGRKAPHQEARITFGVSYTDLAIPVWAFEPEVMEPPAYEETFFIRDMLPQYNEVLGAGMAFPEFTITWDKTNKEAIIKHEGTELMRLYGEKPVAKSPYYLSAFERAYLVKSRLIALVKNDLMKPVKVSALNGFYIGEVDGVVLFTVTPEDAAGNSESAKLLAEKWASVINAQLL